MTTLPRLQVTAERVAAVIRRENGLGLPEAEGHAPVGSSRKHYWGCTGSFDACRGVPERPAGEAARLGTVAHAAYELMLQTTATDLPVGHADIDALPEHFAAKVPVAVAQTRALIDPLLGDDENPRGELFQTEIRLPIAAGLGHPELADQCWGIADVAVYDPKTRHAMILDLKTGAEAVSADCSQLALLGAGWVSVIEGAGFGAVDTLTVGIIQFDREPDVLSGPIDEWQEKFRAYGEHLAAMLSPAEDKPRFAGDHCRYCPAQASCGNYSDWLLWDLSDNDKPRSLSLTEMAELVNRAPAITALLSAVKAELLNRAHNGETLPETVKLVRSITRRGWSDPAEVLIRGTELGVTDILAPPKLITPAQAEQLLPTLFKSELKKLVSKPEGAVTVAPANDRRKAFDPTEGFDLSNLSADVDFDGFED
jgi:hypothetical protein